MRILVSLTLLLFGITLHGATSAPTPAPANAGAEIHPALELLSGVLTQTDWIQRRGPKAQPHPYFQELRAHFARYSDHAAVRLVRELLPRGFSYDAHPKFALCLGPLPDLERVRDYPDDLATRCGGLNRVEELRLALRDLARESNFAEFLSRHERDFERWKSETNFDRERVTLWLEAFYGRSNNAFHLVLAPAMFPNGGYGCLFPGADGRTEVFQVVRADSNFEDGPHFPVRRELELLALHEWGHSFVNPAVEAHSGDTQVLAAEFAKVEAQMKRQAYPRLATYANEQVLRACVIYAAQEFYGASVIDQLIAKEEARGFRLTRPILEQLRLYARQRDRYPTFERFVPDLFAALKTAQTSAGTPAAPAVPASSALNSLSPADRSRMEASGVRLWDGPAPQARGTTPADIPVLYPVLPPPGTAPVGAVIVFPGGGYTDHAAHESFPIAEHFRAARLAAFVVTYRLRPYDTSVSLLDAQQAVRLVRARAKDFGVDPKQIAVIGFSAGGHLAANLSNHGDDGTPDATDPVDRESSRVQSAMLIYPALLFGRIDRSTPAARVLPALLERPGVHRDVTAQTPPTFLVVGYDDDRTPYEHCLAYSAKLHEAGVKFELHVLGVGGHGFALRVEDPRIHIWGQLATNWLATCGFNVEPK